MEVLVVGSDMDNLAAKEQDDILQWIKWIFWQQQSYGRHSFSVVDMAEASGERFLNEFQSMDL